MQNIIVFIGICIFIVLDVLTKGFVHNFIIKFILVIPIFIQDLIRLDRTVFRGFGFWCYSGLGGSGKTISIVNRLMNIKKKYSNVLILSNFYLQFADGKIDSWRDLLETTNYNTYYITEKEYNNRTKWGQKNVFMCLDDNNTIVYKKTVNDGVIFAFDEIHLTFESTRWQDAPTNLLDYISQQRKYHKFILGSSQVFTRIDKKLREQTNFVVECKSLFMGRLVINSFYKTVEYIANGEKMDKGQRKRKCAKRECYIAYDHIREMYDTEEIMKDLQTGKSEDQKLLDMLKKVAGNEV